MTAEAFGRLLGVSEGLLMGTVGVEGARLQGECGKRLMGFEPTTFCMASRRSSQLSYSRANGEYSPGPGASGASGSRLAS